MTFVYAISLLLAATAATSLLLAFLGLRLGRRFGRRLRRRERGRTVTHLAGDPAVLLLVFAASFPGCGLALDALAPACPAALGGGVATGAAVASSWLARAGIRAYLRPGADPATRRGDELAPAGDEPAEGAA